MKKVFKHRKFTAKFEDDRGYISFTGSYGDGCGAIGSEISAIYPDFKIIADMHLFNVNPAEPMHSIENALFYIKENNFIGLSNHWLISQEDAKELIQECKIAELDANQEAKEQFNKHTEHFRTLKLELEDRKFIEQPLSEISNILKGIYNKFTREERAEFLGRFTFRSPVKALESFRRYLSDLSNNNNDASKKLPEVISLMRVALEKHHKSVFELTKEIHELKVNKIVREYEAKLRPIWKQKMEEVYSIVENTPFNLTNGFVDPFDENGDIIPGYLDWYDDVIYYDKIIAVAEEENCDVTDVDEEDDNIFLACGKRFLVLTSDEVDSYMRQEAENYIDEVIIPEIPDSYRYYFDEEKMMDDIMADGAGHLLARYDGIEIMRTVDGEQYFLYRQ